MMDEFDVDIQPDVTALKMFRSMSFTPWYALGEFVDNSITSSLKNYEALKLINGPDYQLQINIFFAKDGDELTVEDNAAGISRTEMERALKTGQPPDDVSVGLSKHGVGLKAASFWWGSKLTIETYPINSPNGWRVELDISDVENLKPQAHVVSIPNRGYPGTRVVVNNLWQRSPKGKTLTAIRSYLPSIYRSYIDPKFNSGVACEIRFQDQILEFHKPELLVAPFWPNNEGAEKGAQPVLWRDDVSFSLDSGKVISGWIGILDSLSRDYSGFFLHYRGKGIAGVVPISQSTGVDDNEAKDSINRSTYKPRKIFGQSGGYRDQSFIGEFDITSFGKTITTDSPLWSPDEEEEFVNKLFDHMNRDEKNYLKMAKFYRRNKVAKGFAEEHRKIAEKEGSKAQNALDGRVDHSTPQIPESELRTAIESIPESDSSGDKFEIPVKDVEGHEHQFKCVFVQDRSRDFLTVQENSDASQHQVIINTFHPVLDGIILSPDVRKTLLRICLSLSASEVLLRSYEKRQVRTKMNTIMNTLGSGYQDD